MNRRLSAVQVAKMRFDWDERNRKRNLRRKRLINRMYHAMCCILGWNQHSKEVVEIDNTHDFYGFTVKCTRCGRIYEYHYPEP